MDVDFERLQIEYLTSRQGLEIHSTEIFLLPYRSFILSRDVSLYGRSRVVNARIPPVLALALRDPSPRNRTTSTQ